MFKKYPSHTDTLTDVKESALQSDFFYTSEESAFRIIAVGWAENREIKYRPGIFEKISATERASAAIYAEKYMRCIYAEISAPCFKSIRL